MKNIKKVSAICLSAILVLSLVFVLAGCTWNPDTAIRKFTRGNGSDLRVGIISDSQLRSPDDKKYTGGELDYAQLEQNLRRSLKGLKARNVNMVLFPGDVGDSNNPKAYDIFNQCVDEVFGDTDVIFQTIMGNHDYWENGTPENCRQVFADKIGSPLTHYVVNGYHFIGASPTDGINMSDMYKNLEKWLRKHIEIAKADSPDKPIFVQTHNGAKDTMYGTDDWGDKNLGKILNDYEQVINFSGHSHYSMLDERAIHQGNFTSITTQSVSYIELEQGKANGTIPPRADDNPMGFIMDITANNVEIQRINFGEGKGDAGYEEKADQRWNIGIPVRKANFTYTNDRIDKANNTAPTMTATSGTSAQKDGKTYLTFGAGSDNDFVHSYKLVWSNGTEQLYFSDFFNGLDDMATTVDLAIEDMKKGTYSVKIYAVDSWGKTSEQYVSIDNVVIA